VIGFEYAQRSADDPAWLAAAVDAYRQMLSRLITEGWKPNVLHAHYAEFAGIITSKLSQEFGIP
jgi:hypothetical protein